MEKDASMEYKIKAFGTKIKDKGFVDSQEGALCSFQLINGFSCNFMFFDSALLNSSLFPSGSPSTHFQHQNECFGLNRPLSNLLSLLITSEFFVILGNCRNFVVVNVENEIYSPTGSLCDYMILDFGKSTAGLV